ncbi:peptidyl-prolyl cis-trans isomerase [Variovorax sp. GT1P44]|uniref:peptidylprolyl isomerase n=1 Tax=Variovorax sp. GT1P44 TaxID=3443742 RepID=UPI003F48968E
MRKGLMSTLRRWLREPLLHFVIAGFALFAIYGGPHARQEDSDPRRIEVTSDDLRRIEISWLARWQRPPTEAEMRGLIEEHVKEEILYREALALGLEKGDTIVRRRLAQKMDFVTEDVAALREPNTGEVEAWFAKNLNQFTSPPLVTFRHLYFASDKRGAGAQAQASKVLTTLAGPESKAGDAFIFQSAYAEQSPEQVARVFGAKFSSGLFQTKPGGWRGPLESGYGWHLVWIEALTAGQPPPFETVAAQAKAEWLSEQRAETKRATFEALKARYEVVVSAPALANGAAVAVPEQK